MRLRYGGAVVLLVLVGCSGDGSTPTAIDPKIHVDATSLQGQVMGIAFTPDSTYVGVGGVKVTFIRVGPLPVDTFPPIDSGALDGHVLTTAQRAPARILFDPLPGDTIVPPDSGPPPPPPPPPTGCGRQGDTLATTETDGHGNYQTQGLQEGIYDLLATPGEGSGFRKGFSCGVFLRSGSPTNVTIFVPAGAS
jgi:hypothetical protein